MYKELIIGPNVISVFSEKEQKFVSPTDEKYLDWKAGKKPVFTEEKPKKSKKTK
jgi:hypothetical protein